jgi:hypothetical protein
MSQQIQPRWATLKDAAKYSGLSERYLQDFIRDGLIQSSLVKRTNAKRGRRLIDLWSLDECIQQGLNKVGPPVCRVKDADS